MSSDESVQCSAISALSHFPADDVIPVLLDKYCRNESDELRTYIVETLGKLGDQRGRWVIDDALTSEYEPLQRAAREALGNLGSVEDAAPLLKTLHDGSANIYDRSAALASLSKIDSSLAARELESLLYELLESEETDESDSLISQLLDVSNQAGLSLKGKTLSSILQHYGSDAVVGQVALALPLSDHKDPERVLAQIEQQYDFGGAVGGCVEVARAQLQKSMEGKGR
jgi:HEAT repeat protein